MPFSGIITALITPFKGGELDEQGFKENIEMQLDHGVNALLVLGTTGEGANLSTEEQKRVVEIAAREKRVPLIVNAGDLSTARTVEKVRWGEKRGADGFLVITPYYNCPSQEGLALHFETIAQETDLPIILYNHPKRTGVTFSIELLCRLAKQRNIVGIKDASGSISYWAKIRRALPHFSLYAGDDLCSLPLLAIGGAGLFSVLSNLLPAPMREMVENFDRGLYETLLPFMEATQLDTNPIPIKAMMQLAHLPAGDPRPPLVPLGSCWQKSMQQLFSHPLLRSTGLAL